MKILITGAQGFLGAALAAGLERGGAEVVRCGRGAASPGVQGYRQFDLDADDQSMLEAVRGIDVLVHLAWGSTPSVSNKHPVPDLLSNVVGTVRLFDACAKAGVGRIVFASSGGQVYGEVDSAAILESTATNPKSAYGIGKLSCEKYLALFGSLHGMSVMALRIANLYGPGQSLKDGFGVIPTVLSRLQRNETVQIFGDGKAVRDFVHIDDVVDAFCKAVYSSAQGVLNISSGVGVSIGAIVRQLEAATGLRGNIAYLPARASDPRAIVLSNQQAASVLAWAPRIAFADGLGQTVKTLQLEQERAALPCATQVINLTPSNTK